MNIIGSVVLGFFTLLPFLVCAQEQKEAVENFKGSNFLILVGNQESNGKKGFHLTYEKPKKPVATQSFQLAGYDVKLEQFSFEPGMQTVLYRFVALKGKEKREIDVLYSGMLSLVAGGDGFYFYVAEEYQKSIRYYAMYINEPGIESAKKVVETALQNADSALVATRWAGKESSIFIYDSKRLTE